MSTLLVVDGDSFAHRAYHALPKSIRLNAVVGFTNMLTRLWEAERPAAVFVGWDTLTVPTYRHEAFAAYQSGRVFEESLLEQLEVLPDVVRACGFAAAKAAGYEADDFLAAAAHAWPGDVLVATSDRDAFQLVSDRVTVLQPTRGVSEISRIGPAEVRERYGVEPEQVPDLIALRGDPSDKLPGARGHRPEEGGRRHRRVRVPRSRARRRAVRRRGGGLAALSTNRNDGRLRSDSSPRRHVTYMGGGVLLRWRPRAQSARGPASVPRMNEWLTQRAQALGVDGLSEADEKILLDLARIAAHESGDRRNAPLLCYLLGRADGELDALAEIVRSTS